MTTSLHLATTQATDQVHHLLQTRQQGDDVVLMGNGVNLLHKPDQLNALASTGKLFILADDAHHRGLPIPPEMTPISYAELVTLCAEHARTLSWY